MNWFWMALFAAVLWGLGYTINQITLKTFSAYELLFFESVTVSFVLGGYLVYTKQIGTFFTKLTNPKELMIIIASSAIYTIASILIFKSISSSNATIAAIIESCYPIFTVIFAFIIFGQLQINLASAIGFIMIISGIVLVKLYGQH
ncbi:MAG: EamA family transporter [Burkholderiales bacterium]|nr:EamA family transporter [Burkholderiales bacterium]